MVSREIRDRGGMCSRFAGLIESEKVWPTCREWLWVKLKVRVWTELSIGDWESSAERDTTAVHTAHWWTVAWLAGLCRSVGATSRLRLRRAESLGWACEHRPCHNASLNTIRRRVNKDSAWLCFMGCKPSSPRDCLTTRCPTSQGCWNNYLVSKHQYETIYTKCMPNGVNSLSTHQEICDISVLSYLPLCKSTNQIRFMDTPYQKEYWTHFIRIKLFRITHENAWCV